MPTYPQFHEEKTTQIAARLIALSGGRMNYLKLLKLLYIIDRTAFDRWSEPITFDRYYSMPKGPVLSQTFDKIKCSNPLDENSYWHQFISKLHRYEVSLTKESEYSDLSQAELELVDEVFGKYGNMNPWDLVKLCHTFKEYHDPHGSSQPIAYTDILRALGKSEDEIQRIDEELQNQAYLDMILN